MDHENKVRNSVLPGKQCLPVRRKTCPATYFPRAAMTSSVNHSTVGLSAGYALPPRLQEAERDLRRLLNDLIRLEDALAKRWDGSKGAAAGRAN
ncbi:hypothetical protein AB0937_02805 [Streptomyces sp. NPDC047880]|uniref:hypothetical protein n=1 Tax=Streptomyces sp. NPDC047880 TaxID=3155626 RepID=UPI0034524465